MFVCVYSGDYEIYLSLQCLLFETDTLGCTNFRKEDKRALSGWIARRMWVLQEGPIVEEQSPGGRSVESGRVRRSLR